MKKPASAEVKRGQAISFRVPSDTPDHLVKHLQKLKETERRNFSSKIAEFVMQGVSHSYSREKETITIPLPHKLSKSERDWLKHEHSEALLGSIIYQLLTDPIRVTSLFSSLNSHSLDINEALYLQEDEHSFSPPIKDSSGIGVMDELASAKAEDVVADDLDDMDWETVTPNPSGFIEEDDDTGNDLDSLLGDFLAKMNK